MVTSMNLIAADQVMNEPRPVNVKPRGRKSNGGLNQKKQPKRGLGVEQLERLRLQERWKMNEMPQPPQNQAPFPFSDPLDGVPVHCCPRSYFGRRMIVSNGGLGFENGGFSFESSAIGGLALVIDSQFGIEDQQRELSSKQNKQSPSDHCDSWHTGAKIKQIHGKRSSKNGSFLVEYEFLPGTSLKEMNQFEKQRQGSVAVEGEASSMTTYGDINSNPLDLSLKLSF